MEYNSAEEKQMYRQELYSKAEILKHMAHPVRLCILIKLIREGPRNVSALQGCMDVAQPTISQHLGKLKAAGIVAARRHGKEVEYQISNESIHKVIQALS